MNRIILVTLMLASAVLYADVINKTYDFSPPEISRAGDCQTINFEGCLLSAPTGYPLMPPLQAGKRMRCISGSNCLLSENTVIVVNGPDSHFQPVWTTPFNPMSVFVTEAMLDDLPMQPGDEVGIFDVDPNTGNEICVGAGVLTGELTGGNFLEIIASMDDGSNPDSATGFTPGNEILYRLYSASSGNVVQGIPEYPYPGYDEVFTALGNAIVSLSGYLTVEHVLSLQAGWSGISSWVVPYNPSIPDLLSGVSGQVVIIRDNDEFYQPGTGAGTLLSWDYQSGYLIKLSEPADVSIEGELPSQNTVNLTAGWNLIPVLNENNVMLTDVFNGNLDKVEVVKDAVGLKVYWPDEGIFTLQVLQSGKAYLVKTSEGFTVNY